jgi:hypothetical protein
MTKFWVQDGTSGTGVTNATTHWDEHSGGAGGDAIPTLADDVHFDASSFGAAGQIVTLDSTLSVLSMDWTGSTNTPQFKVSAWLNVYGNQTYITAMTTAWTAGGVDIRANTNITTNGLTLAFRIAIEAYTLSLQDALTSSESIYLNPSSVLTTNNNNVTVTGNGIIFQSAGSHTVNPGASTLTITGWVITGGTITVSANTSTINCSGNFSGGGLLTYWIVNLTGNTCALTGANRYYRLTRTGTAAASTMTIGADQIVDGVCSLIGNSAINTLTVSSSVPGTKRKITAQSFVLTNVILSDDIELGTFTSGGGNTVFRSSQEAGVQPDTTSFSDLTRQHNPGVMANMTWERLPSKLWVLNFNGTTSKITHSASTVKVAGISFWCKPTVNTRSIFSFDGGYHSVEITAANLITALGWISPTIYVNGVSGAAVGLGRWNFVSIGTISPFTMSALVIGQEATWYSGLLGLPQIYPNAQSFDDVKAMFENQRRYFL